MPKKLFLPKQRLSNLSQFITAWSEGLPCGVRITTTTEPHECMEIEKHVIVIYAPHG